MIKVEEDLHILKRARKLLHDLDKPNAVCKLKKALYGLRQTSRQWHAELDRVLQKIGLTPTNADPCVYVDKSTSTFVLVYVDDILIFTNNQKMEKQIKKILSDHFGSKI